MTLGEERLVAFEATALELQHSSGVGGYTSQLIHALVKRGGWRFALLSSRAPADRVPEGLEVPACFRFPNRSLWMQLAVPRIVARLNPRLCHFTNSVAPLFLSCPFVVNVYDMSLFLFPHLQPRKSRWLVRSILPAVTRKAAAIITVSDSSKRDILRLLKLPPEKVHVVYASAADDFRPIKHPMELERIRSKYGLHDPFILSVCTVEPRKNLSRLVAAFAQLRRHGRREQLVLAGQFGWHFEPLLKQLEEGGLKHSVKFLGYVPAGDLPVLYNLARLVAFPSLYEGFGLPIVEAMACGTPVLTSNRSSMAEIGHGAALLVDPLGEEEIEQGLMRLLSDDTLRQELRERGFARAAEFAWSRAAEETAAVYRKIGS